MKVTIGERLGLLPKVPTPRVPEHISDHPMHDPATPVYVEPEKVIRFQDIPSAPAAVFESIPEPVDSERLGPPRVRGEMVWLHKTAPVLVIEGRRGLSAEDHAAGRRR